MSSIPEHHHSPQSIIQESRYLPPSEASLPALALQVTCLVDSYMLWVGATDEQADNVHKAISQGSLCKDWACAMPTTNSTVPASGTSIFRAPSSDIALSMAQRLARRFKKQIFLSIDIPPTFLSMGSGSNIVLEVEKKVVEVLKELEQKSVSERS